jgi:hypothetical protein
MKKTIVFILSVLFLYPLFGQQQDTTVYCLIKGKSKFMSNNLNIVIDDGSSNGSTWNPKINYLKDENGKKISFESMVSALNFMATKGWQFVQGYAITVDKETEYHWLLKK